MPETPRPREPRLSLAAVLALIAGLAVGLWLLLDDLRRMFTGASPSGPHLGPWDFGAFLVALAILGGLSIVGPPLLLGRRLGPGARSRRPWGPGEFLWFSQGTACWLLWPPIVHARLRGQEFGEASTAPCYAYGTPLMAVFVAITLLADGRFGRRRRRRRRTWRESFGLILGLAWACTGLYLLAILYYQHLRNT